jgi:amidase
VATVSGDPTRLDATTVATLVQQGRLTAVDVVDVHLRQVAALNPRLNAVVTVAKRRAALAEAAAVDERVRTGECPPLAGVPVVVKDNIATAGMRTTWGSRLLAHHVPKVDATAVARLRRAGAIVIGKGNTPEFAGDLHTDNEVFGSTVNPLDPGRTPGGSSGGVAVAVASLMAPLGLATDFGGSIRWPAQCTGLVGLRPTIGRVPGSGQVPSEVDDRATTNSLSFQARMQTIGPLARTVDDLELALDVLSGPDDTDMDAVPVSLCSSSSVDPLTLRFGWLPGEGSRSTGEEASGVLSRAIADLAERVGVVNLDPGVIAEAEPLFTRIRRLEAMAEYRPLVIGREADLSPRTRHALTEPPASVGEYLEAVAERDLLRTKVLAWFETVDVLLLPVSLVPAFPVEAVPGPDEPARDYWQTVAPCRAISLFGLPAASVPVGATPDGAPISMQVVGRPFHEHHVLAAARLLTARTSERLSPRPAPAPRPPAA